MDGTNRRVLVYNDLGLPNGLTLVHTTNELCYTDAGSWSIRCVDLGSLTVRKVKFIVLLLAIRDVFLVSPFSFLSSIKRFLCFSDIYRLYFVPKQLMWVFVNQIIRICFD